MYHLPSLEKISLSVGKETHNSQDQHVSEVLHPQLRDIVNLTHKSAERMNESVTTEYDGTQQLRLFSETRMSLWIRFVLAGSFSLRGKNDMYTNAEAYSKESLTHIQCESHMKGKAALMLPLKHLE